MITYKMMPHEMIMGREVTKVRLRDKTRRDDKIPDDAARNGKRGGKIRSVVRYGQTER